MKTPYFLMPVAVLGLMTCFAPLGGAAVVYDFEGQNLREPISRSALLENLFHRFAITALPSSDPSLLRASPDGPLRGATEIYAILEADQQLATVDRFDLEQLLNAMKSQVTIFPSPAPGWVVDLKTGVRTIVQAPGGGAGGAPVNVRLKTAMALLERLAQDDPLGALSHFNDLFPALATKQLIADGSVPTPDLDMTFISLAAAEQELAPDPRIFAKRAAELEAGAPPPELITYFSTSGDLAIFAQAIAKQDADLALQWYVGHRPKSLSGADSGFTNLMADIARKDLFEAFSLTGQLLPRDRDDATLGIIATATNRTQWTLLVEALRKPVAVEMREPLLRSLGREIAKHGTAQENAAWFESAGFTAAEKTLLTAVAPPTKTLEKVADPFQEVR